MILAVDWVGAGLGFLASAVVGLLLWALLPRGVVLVRRPRTQDLLGQPLYDTWEIQNDSPLSIEILDVTVTGLSLMDFDHPQSVPTKSLPWDGIEGGMVSLCFDDPTLETRRTDWQRPWQELTVPPGDTLQAHIMNNHMIEISYRRAGWLGLFEKRELVIHGYV